jgi:hypothetical protein
MQVETSFVKLGVNQLILAKRSNSKYQYLSIQKNQLVLMVSNMIL